MKINQDDVEIKRVWGDAKWVNIAADEIDGRSSYTICLMEHQAVELANKILELVGRPPVEIQAEGHLSLEFGHEEHRNEFLRQIGPEKAKQLTIKGTKVAGEFDEPFTL